MQRESRSARGLAQEVQRESHSARSTAATAVASVQGKKYCSNSFLFTCFRQCVSDALIEPVHTDRRQPKQLSQSKDLRLFKPNTRKELSLVPIHTYATYNDHVKITTVCLRVHDVIGGAAYKI